MLDIWVVSQFEQTETLPKFDGRRRLSHCCPMFSVLNLYIDDSGTRNPDKKPGRQPAHGYDWFALGGFVIKAEDEGTARQFHAAFCGKWDITYPLRSADIRAKSGNFHWLAGLSEKRLGAFLEDLYQVMAHPPFVGMGCVIDRPGYNGRYSEKYGRQKWMLCRTAFAVVVERAAKYAIACGRKLDVNVERGDKKADTMIKGYYGELKTQGMPFEGGTSEKYRPLTAEELRETLYDLKFKKKTSPMAQLADLYTWPICMGGYDEGNRPYARLMDDGKLVDCKLSGDDIPHLGIKYSCWEGVKRKPRKQ